MTFSLSRMPSAVNSVNDSAQSPACSTKARPSAASPRARVRWRASPANTRGGSPLSWAWTCFSAASSGQIGCCAAGHGAPRIGGPQVGRVRGSGCHRHSVKPRALGSEHGPVPLRRPAVRTPRPAPRGGIWPGASRASATHIVHPRPLRGPIRSAGGADRGGRGDHRPRVGSLVFGNDYRHPVVLAKEVATLDLMSEGRVEFGLGAGWMTTDYEQSGMAHDPPASASAVWPRAWRS